MSASLVTRYRPLVPCCNWYWGAFTILPTGGRVTGIHLVNPPKKTKNLDWFCVALCQCIHAHNRERKGQGSHHQKKLFEVMVPVVSYIQMDLYTFDCFTRNVL